MNRQFTQQHWGTSTRSASLRRLISTPLVRTGRLCVGTARSRQDYEKAFGLLQRQYESAGLASSNSASLRLMPYHMSPASQVFVARVAGEVVGTVTLVSDSIDELPIASTYPQAISEVHRRVGRIGEITSLAVDRSYEKPGEVFAQLTRLLTFFARAQRLQHLAAVVHPRHAKFYKNAMGFDLIGAERPCEDVCGNPGVAVLGSVNDGSRYRRRWRSYYFDGDFSSEDLRPRPISKLNCEYFFSALSRE